MKSTEYVAFSYKQYYSIIFVMFVLGFIGGFISGMSFL